MLRDNPSRARPCGRGFTLVELVAVVAVVAIVGVAALGSISNMGSNRSAAAARRLAREIVYARDRATSTGTSSWIVLDTAADTCRVLADNPASPGYASASALTDPGSGRAMQITFNAGEFAGVDLLSASPAQLGFDWLGRPISTSGVVLTSAATISLTGGRTITVRAQTGEVRWP